MYLKSIDQVVRFEDRIPQTLLATFEVASRRFAVEVRGCMDAAQIEALVKAAVAEAAKASGTSGAATPTLRAV